MNFHDAFFDELEKITELQKEAGWRSNLLSLALGTTALTGAGHWAHQGHKGVTNPPTAITARAEAGNRPPLLLRAPSTPGAPRPFRVR